MHNISRRDRFSRSPRFVIVPLYAAMLLTQQSLAQAPADPAPNSKPAPVASVIPETPRPDGDPAPIFRPVSPSAKRVSKAPAGPQDPKAIFVVEGMREARQKLRRAICDIEYETGYEDKRDEQQSETEHYQVMIAFSDTGDFRASWTFPLAAAEERFLRSSADIPLPAPNRTGTFIRTKEKCIQWFEGQPTVDILPVNAPYPAWIKFFDVKALGVYSWIELQQGRSFEEMIDSLLHKPVREVVENPNGVYALTWELGNENSQWRIDVDSRRGFGPVSATMRQRNVNDDPWRTVQEFHTEWEQIESVWVPIRFEGRNLQKPEVNARTVSLRLNWRNVNGTIPDELFALSSLNAPDAVGVVDSTLGSPIEIKVPGQPFAKDREPENRSGGSLRWFIGVNAAALLVIAMAYWYRHRRASR